MTTIGRTLTALRRAGWLAAPVEMWLPHTEPPRRRDLFGVGDVLAAHPAEKAFLMVQATTRPCVAARVAKARQSASLALWIQAGGRFEVWGWCRHAGSWAVRKVALAGADLAPVVVEAPRRRQPQTHVQGQFDFGETVTSFLETARD